MGPWHLLCLFCFLCFLSFSSSLPFSNPFGGGCEGSDSILSYLNKDCYGNCPLRKNYKENIAHLLDRYTSGQDEAVHQVLSALYSHDGTKPLIFHFSGDNGTGKTLFSSLIAKGKFAEIDPDSDSPLGTLFLRGNSFFYDQTGEIRKKQPEKYSAKIEEFKEQIRNDVVSILSKCPEAVIIFDEYTVPNRRILQVMEEFLDGSPIRVEGGKFVSSNHAIFIFLSDFGVEEFSHSHSFHDLVDIIEHDVTSCWGDHLTKMRHVQDNIIPFRPIFLPVGVEKMNSFDIFALEVPESARDFVLQQINMIQEASGIQYWVKKSELSFLSVQCNQTCKDNISRIIYYSLVSSEIYRYRNYRGLEQLFNSHILRKIISQLMQTKKNTKFSVSIQTDLSNAAITVSLPIVGYK